MAKPKRHRHSKELDVGYGYGLVSGWRGIGATYRCKACGECLWFEEDGCYPYEINHNDKKRKKNKRWNPDLI